MFVFFLNMMIKEIVRMRVFLISTKISIL